MKVIKGDLISMMEAGVVENVAHGCNCMCTMGKGFALAVAEAFPEAMEADRATVPGDHAKLGTYSEAFCDLVDHGGVTVFNLYTQFGYGTGKRVEYGAVRSAFMKLRQEMGYRVDPPALYYPKIGAGLGGGDWDVISRIIDEEMRGVNHFLVELP